MRIADAHSSLTLASTSLVDTPNNQVVIGEVATFHVNMHLPEGTTISPNITVQLPDGSNGALLVQRVYIVAASNIVVFNESIVIVDSNNDGVMDHVVASFSKIQNIADNIIDQKDVCSLAVEALVVLNANNTKGRTLTSSSQFTYSNGTTAFNQSAITTSLVIVEPMLSITYSYGSAAGDSGDIFEASVNISHAVYSTAPAYNVNVTALVCTFSKIHLLNMHY